MTLGSQGLCEGVVDGMLPKNASLLHTQGMRQLRELRNSKQSEELRDASVQPAQALFGPQAEPAGKAARRPKRTMRQLREARDSPEVFQVDVPGDHGQAPTSIRMLRPLNPRDDLCVPLNENELEHIVLYIRRAGIGREDLTIRGRQREKPKGV